MESKTFAEVHSEIRHKIKPVNSSTEVSSIRKLNGGGILVELDPKATSKTMFSEAVK